MKAVIEWLNAPVGRTVREWLFYAAFLVTGIVCGALLHS